MPSATESMIASQAMGKMYEVTAPENPSAELGGRNSRFNYARPQQKMYDGKSLVDSVLSQVKYNQEKVQGNYGQTKPKTSQQERSYANMIRNQQTNLDLYNNLMFGYNKN